MWNFLSKYLGTSEYWPVERRVGWIVYASYAVSCTLVLAYTYTHQFENYWFPFKQAAALLAAVLWPLYLLLKAGIWYWGP